MTTFSHIYGFVNSTFLKLMLVGVEYKVSSCRFAETQEVHQMYQISTVLI